MFLGKRFFVDGYIKDDLTLEKSISIARHLWPLKSVYYLTLKGSNIGYYPRLAVLQNLTSVRKTPKLADKFVSFLDGYIYYIMGSDPSLIDFSNIERILIKRERFLKRAFSRPFVCSEEDLPWIYPEMEYSGISFPQFNFMMYIATAWKIYVESIIVKNSLNINSRSWSGILREIRPGLMSILDALSHGTSLMSASSLSFFDDLTYMLMGEKGLSAYPGEKEMKNHVENFLAEIQRFSRIRHAGVINVSFMWPAIDCEPLTFTSVNQSKYGVDTGAMMIVPGLSFPMVLNNIGSNANRSGKRSSKTSTTKELLIDSLGEFFLDKDEKQYIDEDINYDSSDSETEAIDGRVQEIRKGIKLEDLPYHEDDDSSLATNDE